MMTCSLIAEDEVACSFTLVAKCRIVFANIGRISITQTCKLIYDVSFTSAQSGPQQF